MRVTRAAQRSQQEVEELIETPETIERALKDIEPNTTPAVQIEEALPPKTPAKTPGKKGKGKGKKGLKGKKSKTEEEELEQVVEEAERQAAASPVEEVGEQELAQEHTDEVAQAPDDEELPKLPQTSSVRLTRRQLAKLEEEALSKSQRAPSPQAAEGDGKDIARAVTEQAEELIEEKTDVTAGEHSTSTAREDCVEAEPEAALKPARRTRRQKTKREEEQSEEPVAEAAVEGATDPPESVEAAIVDVEAGTPATIEQSGKAEPGPASKSVRLTRRQQAKLEEEQTQTEQQKPQVEPTEEEALKEIVAETEAQAEAVIGQHGVITQETAHEETTKLKEIPPAAAKESFIVQGNDEMTETKDGSHQIDTEDSVEKPSAEAQAVDSQAPEMVAVEGTPHETVEVRPETPTEAEFEADFNIQVDGAVLEEVVPAVKDASEAEPKMLHAEKPFESTTVAPTTNQETIRRTSRSHSKSPMRLEESISAIDRLEEDLESIGTVIPDLEHSDDDKSSKRPQSRNESTTAIARGKTPSKTPAKTPAKAPARYLAKADSKTPGRTPVKAPIPAKAPAAARASIAPKPPVVAKAALPTRFARVPNAPPKSVKPTATSLARASSVRTAPSKDVRKPSTETADYLASKRRPISLSFPTPPPPPKGRAPTKSNFQLSSDSVAAKLRAQKEERLKREAEGAAPPKQRPISMPPLPKSTKPPTVPSFQLPGEATAAKLRAQKEERLKRMEEAGAAEKPVSRANIMPPPTKSTKQLTKPSFQLPGEATAVRLKAQKEERLKRMEEAEAAKKAAAAAPARKPIAHRPRDSLLVRDAPGISIAPPPQSDAPQRSNSLASKRSSIAGVSASRSTSTSSANRNSVLLAEGGKSTVSPVDAVALKVKGKQVFNRDRMEKEAMERERRDKEEAAKRARAEAAERGRIASREWAERQRKKLMGQ